ncbi:MAG: hypothetical protein BMS9Abin22_089 [Gammaproteobacteria bacterium]|nr:MAG: hypothetical protein BMS9Abin22_089 [Gammaproteobacteria bacterium]
MTRARGKTEAFPRVVIDAQLEDVGWDFTDRHVVKFLDEFEWYARALKAAREQGVPY